MWTEGVSAYPDTPYRLSALHLKVYRILLLLFIIWVSYPTCFQMFLQRYIKFSLLLKFLWIYHVVIFVKKKNGTILDNDINCVCRLNLLIVGCSSNSLSIYAFGVFPVSRLTVPSINVDKVIQTFLWANWSKCPRVNI